MIIPCFRCSKEIDTPNSSNADYVIALDMIAKEPREVFIALKHNQATRAKREKVIAENIIDTDTGEEVPPPTEDFIRNQFTDSEYDAVEVPDIATAQGQFGEDLIKVVAEIKEKDIQKTGIVCPDCYKETDFIIWGVHKK